MVFETILSSDQNFEKIDFLKKMLYQFFFFEKIDFLNLGKLVFVITT